MYFVIGFAIAYIICKSWANDMGRSRDGYDNFGLGALFFFTVLLWPLIGGLAALVFIFNKLGSLF